eukprot:CAMPEP_0174863260 /NCGR_PEP_ID=MMETSP1114-20130205/55849_1 /TAXON_ID=312471 /ORGANISM="Neobodo designis, Strain CCAP 1951/1" /LENGTH=372 /DNA_ID=CAMNT_0016098325 /DNA_START=26 /DNA_END=1144 /DNA_ORIENTATION=+
MPSKTPTASPKAKARSRSTDAQTPKKSHRAEAAAASPSPRKVASRLASAVDPEVPLDPKSGNAYHVACTGADIGDHFILVGDPGRVPIVAERFDKGSVTFKTQHREIAIITGSYKGTRVTVLSTGMGTDNCEIVLNELHTLKEYGRKTNTWAAKPAPLKLIRVGTCGSPASGMKVGTLAVTRHAIGMDNTCRYYRAPKGAHPASVAELEKAANASPLGAVGVYCSMAAPAITKAIVEAHGKNKAVKGRRDVAVGTTASGSGFYGCQGRAVGRFRGTLAVPNLVDDLGALRLPLKTAADKAAVGGAAEERVVNIEMENSAICYLSRILGYEAGTVCAVIAARAGETRAFATKDEAAAAIADAITVALDALVSV